MSRRRSLLQYVLLLMLGAGPLQAQTVFLCDMMDVPRQETCCCEEPHAGVRQAGVVDGCRRASCRATSTDPAEDCCDSAVEVGYEPDAGSLLARPPPDHQVPEPAAPVFVACELPLPPERPAVTVVAGPLPPLLSDESNLYLRTERLRI